MEDLKECSICHLPFPRNKDYFYENKSNKSDGLYPFCKSCCIKKSRKWRIENLTKEDLSEINRVQNSRPERKVRNQKCWTARRIAGYPKEYYDKNKEKFENYRNKWNQKRHTISKKEWTLCKEYFRNSCAYCGLVIENHRKLYNQDFHREHVDDDGASDLSNCVPSCKNCNSQKWKFELDIWYNKENVNFKIERYNRISKWIQEDYKNYLD